MASVGQHTPAPFNSPVNTGQGVDANIVRGNDNVLRTKLAAHDSDSTIHNESGPLASRPATAPIGSVYYATDSGSESSAIYTASGWVTVGSSSFGNVFGPASAVNNNLASFDTTTGKLIKDSGIASSAVLLSTGSYANPTWLTSLAWSKITSTPTTIAGYGITDFVSLGNSEWVQLDGSYADPTWITSLAYSKLTGAPSLSGYVVGPGSATDNAVVRFDLATGKLVQNSLVTIADTGAIVTPNTVSWGSVGTLAVGGAGLADLQISTASGSFRVINSGYSTALFSVAEATGNGTFSGSATAAGFVDSQSSGQVLGSTTASTGAKFLRLVTTGADSYFGSESSVGGSFFTGSSAYAAVLYATTNIELIRSGVKRLAATGSGVDIIGNLTVDTDTLFVDATNNRVGVGTTSPATEFDVDGGARVRGTMLVGSDVGTGDAYIDLGALRSGNGYAYIDLVGDTTWTDYGLRIIRNNSGANASSFISHRGTGELGLFTSEAAPMTFWTSSAERMRIDASGNVGIGTTSPSYALSVSGDIATSTASGVQTSLRLFQSGVSNWSISIPVSTQALVFTDTGLAAERMRIDGSGNVGIGTTSPAAQFHISSSAVTKLFIANNDYVGGSVGSGFLVAQGAATGNTYTNVYAFQSGNTAYADLVIPGGNVGIGTAGPSSDAIVRFLHLNDASSAGIVLQGVRKFSFYSSSSSSLAIRDETAGVTRFIMDASGNVGIGNIAPAYKLDVTGTIASNGKRVILSDGNYTFIFRRDENIGIYLGGPGDPANYYDNTNHYFRNATGTAYTTVTAATALFANLAGTGNRMVIADASGTLATQAIPSGDVTGPASATDLAVAIFNGTTGKIIKNSGVTVDASSNILAGGSVQATTTLRSGTPGGGGLGSRWKIGAVNAATVTLDTANYVQVEIDGTLYKLALVT